MDRSIEETSTLPRRRPEKAGILHLGLGNFHRAHQAVFTARALEAEPGPWGIVGVANRARRVVDAMGEQANRYSVLTLDPDGPRCDVLDLHLETLVMCEEPERVVDLVARHDIRVVTLTVTEKAYQRPREPDRPAGTVDDAAARRKPWVIDLLAQGLRARFRAGGAPLSLVSCDNVSANGRTLRDAVTGVLEEEGDSAEVLSWLSGSVGFPCTMVDRIVPATEARHVDMVRALTGVEDRAPVPAEPFSTWVMEDDFPGGRPAWDRAGVVFVDDVAPYELLKLRVVNTTNSLLAYLGLLLEEELIADTLNRHADVAAVADRMIRHEMLPTVTPPPLEVDSYVEQLFARFGNAAVGHRTAQVASDGSVKLPIRIVDPVLHHHARGTVPWGIALLAASYVRVFTRPASGVPGRSPGPEDPWSEHLRRLGDTHRDSHDLVRAVLTGGPFRASLEPAGPWLAAVGDLHSRLVDGGVEEAVRHVARHRP
ncbi:mannitol dehydrogenase family protein [Ornithinimicrobium sp. W1679]|uniref:mannitol dehydrogenase family protein n=1 Tax=Ornithinimicrobium sp. W1679 TaxID=3418770 RepID=UPI003CF3BCB1